MYCIDFDVKQYLKLQEIRAHTMGVGVSLREYQHSILFLSSFHLTIENGCMRLPLSIKCYIIQTLEAIHSDIKSHIQFNFNRFWLVLFCFAFLACISVEVTHISI